MGLGVVPKIWVGLGGVPNTFGGEGGVVWHVWILGGGPLHVFVLGGFWRESPISLGSGGGKGGVRGSPLLLDSGEGLGIGGGGIGGWSQFFYTLGKILCASPHPKRTDCDILQCLRVTSCVCAFWGGAKGGAMQGPFTSSLATVMNYNSQNSSQCACVELATDVAHA